MTTELRNKLLEAKVFNRSLMNKDETFICIQLMHNELAVVSDRILASKTLWQISENVLYHVKKQADEEKAVFLRLEHDMQKERSLNHLIDEVKDINPDDLMLVLQKIMEKKGI